MRNQAYCSLCGAPIHEGGSLLNKPEEWLTHSILLTTAHTTSSEPQALILDAYHPRDCSPRTPYSFHLGPSPPPDSTRHVLKIPAKGHGESTLFDILSLPSISSLSPISTTKDPAQNDSPTSSKTDFQSHKLYSSNGNEILPGHTVTGFAVETQKFTPSPTANGGGDLYIPIHEACLEIAEHYFEYISFISTGMNPSAPATGSTQESSSLEDNHAAQDSTTTPKKKITNLTTLFEVLYKRLLGQVSPLSQPYILDEPHDYYGGRQCRNVCWERDDGGIWGEILEANPLKTPHPTTNSETPNTTIPFLWDHDTSSLSPEGKRQLSHPHFYDPEKCPNIEEKSTNYDGALEQETEKKENIVASSPEIRNRARIWKILDTAWVGDVEMMDGSGRWEADEKGISGLGSGRSGGLMGRGRGRGI